MFIHAVMKSLKPAWIRQWDGSNVIRTVDCGGRRSLMERFPRELQQCLGAGSDTTLMVWADLDHDRDEGNALKHEFWKAAQAANIAKKDVDGVVFIFAKDRLENWIQFLESGATDESFEAPKVRHLSQ